jgi:hypothetical protein
MIVTEEFIWRKDHYVCHLTEESNMESIIEKGLLPSNGKRCQAVNDERIGVFCFDGLHHAKDWAEILYNNDELETLKILRFNLKNRKWHIDWSNQFVFAMYLPYKVLPQRLSYLDITNKQGETIPITKLFDLDYKIRYSFCELENGKQICVDECNLGWYPIEEYKTKIKKL